MTPEAAIAGAGLNSTAPRQDIGGEVYPDGELPQMGGGGYTSLPPGTYTFRLPVELPRLWSDVKIKDDRTGMEVDGVQLKFDKNAPLVVVGGEQDGETFTATFSTKPIPRVWVDKKPSGYVSDLALLLDTGLEGNLPIPQRTRPMTQTGPEAIAKLKAAINKYAGKTVRLQTGLSATCNPTKVRFVVEKVLDPATNTMVDNSENKTIPDPAGTTGCALPGTKQGRYYTKDFKRPAKVQDPKTGLMIDNPDPGYDDTIACNCGDTEGKTVVLRGFPRVEQFLAPVAKPGQ